MVNWIEHARVNTLRCVDGHSLCAFQRLILDYILEFLCTVLKEQCFITGIFQVQNKLSSIDSIYSLVLINNKKKSLDVLFS